MRHLLVPVLLCVWGRLCGASFVSVLQPDVLLKHGVLPSDLVALLAQDGASSSASRPHFACGPLSELHSKRREVESESQHATSTVFVSKRHDKGCFLAFMTTAQASAVAGDAKGSSAWTLDALPETLKVHATALSYLQRLDYSSRRRRRLASPDQKADPGLSRGPRKGHQSKLIADHAGAQTSDERKEEDKQVVGEDGVDDDEILEHEILVEFVHAAVGRSSSATTTYRPTSPTAAAANAVAGAFLSSQTQVQQVWLALVAKLAVPFHETNGAVRAAELENIPWNRLVKKYLTVGDFARIAYPAHCVLHLSSASVAFRSHSVVLSSVSRLDAACTAALFHAAASYPPVLRIAVQPAAQLVNYEARGIIQGGTMGEEPFREAGLEGQGQICGVADSGVNDLSCFFLDDSGAYPTRNTNRSGVVEPLRRKIVQYVSHADDLDEEGGHGTHVCGTVAGASLQEFGQMSGMAPRAKIAFFDIGVTNRDFLKLPAIDDIFDAAYGAGARVHTNSWGNLGGLYGQMSFDVDAYTHAHPDFLVIFAAGNSGDLGGKSIISPGNAKNALSVGAAQVRTVLSDELRTYSGQNTALAYFSSLGPTRDGRCVCFAPLCCAVLCCAAFTHPSPHSPHTNPHSAE